MQNKQTEMKPALKTRKATWNKQRLEAAGGVKTPTEERHAEVKSRANLARAGPRLRHHRRGRDAEIPPRRCWRSRGELQARALAVSQTIAESATTSSHAKISSLEASQLTTTNIHNVPSWHQYMYMY